MAAPSKESDRAGPSSERLEMALVALEADHEPGDRLERLQELTGLLREQRHRETASKRVFQDVQQILTKSSHEVELACGEAGRPLYLDPQLQLTAECFRCLRNACVRCAGNQDMIRDLDLIGTSVKLVDLFQKLNVINQESRLTAFRCGLQFLGNAVAGNEASQRMLWKDAFPDLFLGCLSYSDEKIVTYSCMILFTCLNSERLKDLQSRNLTVALRVVQAYQKLADADWAFLIISEYLLRSPELVNSLYAKLSHQERVALLDLMIAKLVGDEPLTSEFTAAFLSHTGFVASRFQEKCKSVLKLASSDHSGDEEALTTIRLLHVLCEMSANCDLLPSLQAFPGLLQTAVETLQMTHLAGKQTPNVFTTSPCVRGEGDISSPVAGFKSHLIRLIGNLCYKDKNNQDKVYQLDGIPLILDSCSMDDNNPFLKEWAVYAIRNLTEQNKRNQELIAKMENHGLADTAMLKKMGLEVEQRDGKLTVRSTRKASGGK
ncbi:ataxin-10-like [Monodelphis domestica]|uniref:Ataxin-10 n=1 Tax=Monodelphis domestica TaxID=13616 RepID=A0A5F8G4N9_MONDO|nr:ataxin-10-like [Monodelphis domestica]XP_056661009.1 ataxin-10-like [Monodelphis domestica]XP_056661010.1 ataxin-10-like [Monodelphis domestica]